jgi:hypothetical protein
MTGQPQPIISHHLAKRLLAYATVAGTASACSSQAAAEVIYTPIQRHVRSSFFIDLNHDGLEDFQIYSSLLSGAGIVKVLPARGNRILAAGPDQCFLDNAAAPLPGGAVIGPGKPFQASATCMAYLAYGALSSGGLWKEAEHRYLGLAFEIDGTEHFGWARLSLSKFLFNNTAEIEGYAYETIPGKPIIAGDQGNDQGHDDGNATEASAASATLGALAAGAPALTLWRKEEGPK